MNETKSDKEDPAFWASLMACVCAHSWRTLTMHKIAEHLQISLADLTAFFPDKQAILVFFMRRIDTLTLASYQETSSMTPMDLPLKDRLFDILMMRLEHLLPYRPWVGSFFKGTTCSPCDHHTLGKQLIPSLSDLCEAVGIKTQGVQGRARVLAVSSVYLYAMYLWLTDNSPDQGVTMTSLDRGLSFMSGWLEDA